MSVWRRALGTLALLCVVPTGFAQDFPAKPIRIVVPFPPGGGTDIVARRIGEQLRQDLGQPVIVENRAGAAGNIGAEYVARAPADGYTLMMTAAPFAIAPAIYPNLPFDPVRDFTPITQIATVPLLLVTQPESPLNTVTDLLERAKAEGDTVSFATFGNGSPPHLVGESIQLLARVQMTHVPYKGGQAAMPDIVSGRVTFAILDAVSTTPLVKGGRLKALAITGPKRSPVLPDVPTLSEAGIPFDTVGWHALFGPANLPPPITERINQAVNKVLAQDEMRDLIVKGGSIPVEPPTTAKQWSDQFLDDVKAWAQVARDSGARID